MKKRSTPMEIVNQHAAGIDVGSRSHYVAVQKKLLILVYTLWKKDDAWQEDKYRIL